MKNKIHLFYGIVIGILLCACTGQTTSETTTSTQSTNQGMPKFNQIEIRKCKIAPFHPSDGWQGTITDIRYDKWTIMDWEINGDSYHFLVGK